MATQVYATAVEADELPNIESSVSGISWGAIVGGAIAAIAATFVFAALGSALGLMSVSPWQGAGVSAAAIGVGAAVWIVVMQWLASAFGGYLTGRLRTKWAAMGTDEVFFRDTAHGFLAWALATVFVFVFAASIAGGGANLAATAASGAAQAGVQAAANNNSMAPYLDTLFRPTANMDASRESPAAGTVVPAQSAGAPGSSGATPAASPVASPSPSPVASSVAPGSVSPMDVDDRVREESGRLLSRSLVSDLSGEDRTYLANVVARQTGLSEAEAEDRLDQITTTMKEDAETARKAAVALSFLTALSLVIGAFVAAAAGALGGRDRDAI